MARDSSRSEGFVKRRAVGHDDHRQGPVRRHVGEQGGSLGRVGEREAVGIRAALENRAELVPPPRPRVAHDADGMGRDALVLGPLEQEARDRLVEGLVRRLERADEVVIDVSVDGRLGDRVARGRVAPLPPADQKRALRVRMQVPRIGQELRAGPTGQNRRREHERDRCPVLGERPEPGPCLLRGGEAHDLVVARVPLEELALDGAQACCVPVDGEQHGPAHGSGCYWRGDAARSAPARLLRPSAPPPGQPLSAGSRPEPATRVLAGPTVRRRS